MARPSIFSREYERKMRRRKIRAAIGVVCVVCFIGVLFAGGSLKGFLKDDYLTLRKNFNLYGFFSEKNKDDKQEEAKIDKDIDDKSLNSAVNNTPQQKDIEDKGYDISLSSGAKIKAVYDENKDGVKRFKYVTPMEAANFNINPSGTGMIIMDNSTQSMIYVDIDGNSRAINDFKYVSSTGNEFPKEEILKAKPNYIWCSSPRFLDDDYVAYISQVPWFGRNTRYVWVVNSKDLNVKDRNSHTLFESLAGENLKFGNISDKGLEVDTDEGIRFLKVSEQKIQINQ